MWNVAEIIYGNDGTNYKVLYHTQDMSLELCNRIVEEICVGFLSDYRGNIDKIEQQPSAVTAIVTDLNGRFPEGGKKLILCRQARMREAASPSFFAHIWILDGKEVKTEIFFRKLPKIDLDCSFWRTFCYRGSIAPERSLVFETKPDNFYQEIGFSRKHILEKLFQGCMSSSQYQLKLVLDCTGRDYNQRSREVISVLYEPIPCSLRRHLGFCTFALPGSRLPSEVKVILMDPALMQYGGGVERRGDYEYLETSQQQDPYIWPEVADCVESLLSCDCAHAELIQTGSPFESVTGLILHHNLSVRWKKRAVSEIKEELMAFARNQRRDKQNGQWQQFKEIVLKREEEIWDSVGWESVLEDEKLDCRKFQIWLKELGKLSCLCDEIPELELPQRKLRRVAAKLMGTLDKGKDFEGVEEAAGAFLKVIRDTKMGDELRLECYHWSLAIQWFIDYFDIVLRWQEASLEEVRMEESTDRESSECSIHKNDMGEGTSKENAWYDRTVLQKLIKVIKNKSLT